MDTTPNLTSEIAPTWEAFLIDNRNSSEFNGTDDNSEVPINVTMLIPKVPGNANPKVYRRK